MKIRNLILLLILILASCTNQVKQKDIEEDELDNSNEGITNNNLLFETNCIILYIPDSKSLKKLEQEKSQEELVALEYDKTLAMEFLDNKEILTKIEDRSLYSFKKSSGEIIEIDIDLYSNWGIILFTPEKDPKVIFLNEIISEYDSYFSKME